MATLRSSAGRFEATDYLVTRCQAARRRTGGCQVHDRRRDIL
jgi:hypothetical protein